MQGIPNPGNVEEWEKRYIFCNLFEEMKFTYILMLPLYAGSHCVDCPFGEIRLNVIPDNDLMQQIKSGDFHKLGILYERYSKILFGYFYRLTGHSETSEDLVQNVFFRILKYREKFRNEGKFSTWMFHIAHNVISDCFRKNKRLEYSYQIFKEEASEQQEEDDGIVRNEQLHLLRKAFHELDSESRELLLLSRFKELKYKEIATILNCTEGAVKVRIYRAIKELREIYIRLES